MVHTITQGEKTRDRYGDKIGGMYRFGNDRRATETRARGRKRGARGLGKIAVHKHERREKRPHGGGARADNRVLKATIVGAGLRPDGRRRNEAQHADQRDGEETRPRASECHSRMGFLSLSLPLAKRRFT